MLVSSRKAQALWTLGTLFCYGHVVTAIDLNLDNTGKTCPLEERLQSN